MLDPNFLTFPSRVWLRETMAKCPLFGGIFVLKDASLDFASVRCPEQRGGEAVAINRCFCVCPLLGGSVKRGSAVFLKVLPTILFILPIIFFYCT